jgi:hypothetical protein
MQTRATKAEQQLSQLKDVEDDIGDMYYEGSQIIYLNFITIKFYYI